MTARLPALRRPSAAAGEAPQPAPPRRAPASDGEALAATLQRAEEVLGAEIAALRGARLPLDLADHTFRKRQVHLELVRFSRRLGGERPTGELALRLAALKTLVAEDMALLERHLQAVRRIADILADAIRRTGHDGTYAPPRRERAAQERRP